jgi:hypothetical protein
VFPSRSKQYTPDDDLVYIGMPPALLPLPEHDEVHISITFTWDREYGKFLREQWRGATDKPVLIGGLGYGSPSVDFVPGLYLKRGITFTTRGCNNYCRWCIVPGFEGFLRELPITPGHIIQDNNFLQASRAHKDKVFDMLRTQRGICFKGGLDARLLDDHFVDNVTGLRISELWLACDTDAAIPDFKRACAKLVRAGFNREKIKCYALIGRTGDMDADEARLREIYLAGAMPFAQLYRDFGDKKTEYTKDWNAFARMWQRPPAAIAHMERGTSFREFST